MSEKKITGIIISTVVVVVVLISVADAIRPEVEGSAGNLLLLLEIIGVVGIITAILILFVIRRANYR